jgi:hypothetical protein
MTKLTLMTLVVIFALYTGVWAQQQPLSGRSSIKLADGYLFVMNAADKSFTLEVKGKDVEAQAVGENPAFVVDGRLVQVIIVENKAFLNGAAVLDEEKLLGLHRDWESDYLQKEGYQAKFTVSSEPLLAKDRRMLFWGFTRPKYNETVDRDYFLTTIVGSRVVGLNSPVTKGDAIADYKKLLLDILSTLKVSDKPIDVAKISVQVRNGTYKGN